MGPFHNFSLEEGSQPFQKGKAEGFRIAESYLKSIAKKHYRDMKKGLLTQMATCSTATTHKCNCEFCFTNENDKVTL